MSRRYWRGLYRTQNGGTPPSEWSTDAWEALLLFGAPRFNEPHLLPTVAPGRVGGTSGLPGRAATKKRMREAIADPTSEPCGKPTEGNNSGSGTPCTPIGSTGTPSSDFTGGEFSDGEIAAFHGTMKVVHANIEEQLAILKEFAARERERLG